MNANDFKQYKHKNKKNVSSNQLQPQCIGCEKDAKFVSKNEKKNICKNICEDF